MEFLDFKVTLFAPFSKHNFHEADVGNLIDSPMVLEADGRKALNANNNTPTVDACMSFVARFGSIDLAVLNYNAAGPYPACFNNLTEQEKRSGHSRILDRNFTYMKGLIEVLDPKYALPFAGAYVLGGKQRTKNPYLGTATWDECTRYLRGNLRNQSRVICLRENDVFDLDSGAANRPYVPIDLQVMDSYIENELADIVYEFEEDPAPDLELLTSDLSVASQRMQERSSRFGINLNMKVDIILDNDLVTVFEGKDGEGWLTCELDPRLLRRILDRRAHWNNAEIGCHIGFERELNRYWLDLHLALQFLHL